MKHSLRYIALLSAFALSALLTTTASPRDGRFGEKARTLRVNGKPAGESFAVSWKLVLDSLELRPNGMMVFTPVVRDSMGHEATLRSVVVTGRRQHYVYLRNGLDNHPDAIEFQRRNGEQQTYSYHESIPLEEWMREAYVSVTRDTCGCEPIGSDPGTPFPVNPHLERRFVPAYLPPMVTEEPTISLQGKAYLDYPVNRTELYPDYHNNPAELRKIMQTIDTVRNNKNVEITHIGIHGYASPEGSYTNNIRLAKGRAATLKDYVMRQYDLPERIYEVQYTPEDWDGLDSMLVKSNLPEKEAILQIVRSDIPHDPRNDKIRFEYPETYRFILHSWYPYLRHADYTVSYKIRPMSDEEAAEILRTDPRLLSLNRMFRIANLYTPGSKEYNEVLATAVRIYPEDPVANVNAANVALRNGDLEAARRHLNKAGESREAVHARGVLALLEGKYDEARPLLKAAETAGVEGATENLRLLEEQTEEE